MYVSNRRGLGVPYWDLPGFENRGYIGDQNRAIAAAALRAQQNVTGNNTPPSIVQPVASVAASALAVRPRLPARAVAVRPVQVQVRRAIAVPRRGVGCVVMPRGMGAVTTFITNLTKNGAVFAAGDSWELVITGPPNSPVTISGTHDGRDMGNTPMGTTDASGRLVLRATMGTGEVGVWNEVVHVGSESSAPMYFEVAASRNDPWGAAGTPTSANVVPALQFQGVDVMSDTPAGAVLVPDVRSHLLAIEQGVEDSYQLQNGMSVLPAVYRSQMTAEASTWCQRFPGSCAGANLAALVNEVANRYEMWYNATLLASWNLFDRTGTQGPPGMPPRPAGYVAPAPTSGPGWAAAQQQQQTGSQQPMGGSSSPSSVTIPVPQTQQYPVGNSAPPAQQSSGSSGGSGASNAAPSNSIGDSLTSFFSGGFDVAGIHVPMLAAAAVVGGLWFFGGSRRG